MLGGTWRQTERVGSTKRLGRVRTLPMRTLDNRYWIAFFLGVVLPIVAVVVVAFAM
jgi:hypothetical protein